MNKFLLFAILSALYAGSASAQDMDWRKQASHFSCEECGNSGSMCWTYDIKLTPADKSGQGQATISIDGFQSAFKFTAQTAAEEKNLDIFMLSQNLPTVSLFSLYKDPAGYGLEFRGIRPNTNNTHIACKRS